MKAREVGREAFELELWEQGRRNAAAAAAGRRFVERFALEREDLNICFDILFGIISLEVGVGGVMGGGGRCKLRKRMRSSP